MALELAMLNYFDWSAGFVDGSSFGFGSSVGFRYVSGFGCGVGAGLLSGLGAG